MHLGIHKISSLDVDGPQQLKNTSGSTPDSYKQKSEAIMGREPYQTRQLKIREKITAGKTAKIQKGDSFCFLTAELWVRPLV